MAIPPTEAKVDLYPDIESVKLKERNDGGYNLIFKDYKKKTYWEAVDPETNELVNGCTNLNKIINKSNANGEDNLFLLNSKPANPGDAPFKIDSSEDLVIENPSVKNRKLKFTQDPKYDLSRNRNISGIYNLSLEEYSHTSSLRPTFRLPSYRHYDPRSYYAWSDRVFSNGLDLPEQTRQAFRRRGRMPAPGTIRRMRVFRNGPNWLPNFNRSILRGNFIDTSLYRANLSNVTLKRNNLSKGDARFADLSNSRLIGVKGNSVDLRESNFRNSFVTASQFPNAKLSYADLRNSIFKVVNLKGVSAFEADLRGARLFNVDLRNAELIHAKFSEDTIINFVNFKGANLRGVDFGGLNLDNIDLSNSTLTYADLSGVSMRNAKFKNANFSNDDRRRRFAATLKGADIRGVDFSGANLEGVDFTGMDLTGVDFSGASLRQANLTGTTYDSTTIFDSVSDWTNTTWG